MGYKTAIFDLDGTILDTIEDLADATNHALETYDLPERPLDAVRHTVGNGIRNLIDRSVPEGTPRDTTDLVFSEFKSYYAAHCADKTKPYAGIEDMLEALRDGGVETAVVSNKADFAVQSLIADYFPGLFDVTAGERAGVRRKPAPDTVEFVMDQLGSLPERTVYVGDSEVDIETAANAGVRCIVCAWGYRDVDFLLGRGAETIVGDAGELREAILGADAARPA